MSGRPGIQDCPSNQPKGQALLQLGRGPLNLKHRQTYLGRDPCRLECLKALVDMQRRNRRHRTKVSLTGLNYNYIKMWKICLTRALDSMFLKF